MGIVGFVGIGDDPGAIRVSGVTKRYPDGTEALKDVSFDVWPGERLTLLGRPGAGKTTLLSIIAGDERASAGEVRVDGKVSEEFPPAEREGPTHAGTELRPEITVYNNLAATLDARGVTRRRIGRAIRSAVEALNIEDLLERYAGDLSPEEQDKVEIAQVMVIPARAYLVDEVKRLRETWRDVRTSIGALWRDGDATVVCATTEPQDAVALGGRIAIMHEGAVEQVGFVHELLEDPQTLNVARLLAPGSSAFAEGMATGGHVRLPQGEIAVPQLREVLRSYENRPVVLRVDGVPPSRAVRGVTSLGPGTEATAVDRALHAMLWLNDQVHEPARLPFDPARVLAFDGVTGEPIGSSEPGAITARPVGQTVAVDGDPAQGTRAVNVWLKGVRPPIPVGRAVTLGFNIGPAVRDALDSAAFAEPDWGGREEMECHVLLLSDGCDVSPPGQRLPVPRLGSSPSLEFRIVARESGMITLRFQIYLVTANSLLQELVTSIEAAYQKTEVNA